MFLQSYLSTSFKRNSLQNFATELLVKINCNIFVTRDPKMESQHQLRKYYRDIFPYAEIFDVFRMDEKRELSFFTENDSYMRYITCASPEELHGRINQILPKKIDIGPVYNIRPSKMNGATPVGHELVFDIDLTDYPRSCCEGKSVCKKCYEKIKCAIKLLNYSLRNEFGFTEIGFVFSGRRGVHCWVFDDIWLESSVRSDIVRFYQHVLEKNLYVYDYDLIMKEFDYDSTDIVENWFIRIDKNVTVGMNHLLKAPFSIHPDSLNLAVPLDPENITELEDLPTLERIVENPSLIGPYIDIMKGWRSPNCTVSLNIDKSN